jgi:hypothetical protein
MEHNPQFLLEPELAARWRISPATLRTRRSRGTSLPYYRINGSIRYATTDVLAYETAGRVSR